MTAESHRAEIGAAIADTFVEVCRAELRALKPGNVHVFREGRWLSVADFQASAVAAAPAADPFGAPAADPFGHRPAAGGLPGPARRAGRTHRVPEAAGTPQRLVRPVAYFMIMVGAVPVSTQASNAPSGSMLNWLTSPGPGNTPQ